MCDVTVVIDILSSGILSKDQMCNIGNDYILFIITILYQESGVTLHKDLCLLRGYQETKILISFFLLYI